MQKLQAIIVVLVLALAVTAGAATMEHGFEGPQADLSGWVRGSDTPFGNAYTSNGVTVNGNSFTAYEGEVFATLVSSNVDLDGDGSKRGTELWLDQTLDFQPGDELSFQWFFATTDFLPWNDWADFQLIGQFGEEEYILASVGMVGNGGATGWNLYTHVFGEAFSGTFGFEIHDAYDNMAKSVLGIDAVRVSQSVVPEPGTMVLIGSGLIGLAGTARRKKS